MAIVLSPGSYTFLDAVNRVLRINHIIKGDDDNVTSLSDTQHSADIEMPRLPFSLKSLISLPTRLSDMN